MDTVLEISLARTGSRSCPTINSSVTERVRIGSTGPGSCEGNPQRRRCLMLRGRHREDWMLFRTRWALFACMFHHSGRRAWQRGCRGTCFPVCDICTDTHKIKRRTLAQTPRPHWGGSGLWCRMLGRAYRKARCARWRGTMVDGM